MKSFRVLVVDNEKDLLSRVQQAFPESDGIEVAVAASLTEAKRLVQEQFFNAAFVDLHLHDKPAVENYDGMTILALLRDRRPSCSRYLLTGRNNSKIYELIEAPNPMIHGYVDKLNFEVVDTDIIREMARVWCRHRLQVEGIDKIFAVLDERGVGRETKVHLTVDEIDYLISRIFGQGEASPTVVARVPLELMSGGRSRSVVCKGRPHDQSGKEGIWTVLKISEVAEAREEYRRYCQYVRFMLSLNRRVELLGYFEADTVGAMCYSFAGSSPKRVTSLEQLIVDRDRRALTCLQNVFRPETREWFAQRFEPLDQRNYFARSYGFNPREILREVRTFARSLAEGLGWTLDGDALRGSDTRIDLPTDPLIASEGLRMSPACLVHGDLNAGNLIISLDDNRVFLIDYRHTGPGPVALDFAALETSVRVFTQDDNLDPEELKHRVALEGALSREAWSGPPSAETRPESDWPFWADFSAETIRLARANFPTLTAREYAATCLLWGLRVFRVRSLSKPARARLLAWISNLVRILSP